MCSCGGLAETLGDAQRTKMPHGPAANKWNMVGQVFLAGAGALLVLRVFGWVWPGGALEHIFGLFFEGKNAAHRLVNPFSYKWTVEVPAGGVIGVGLYFKYSGRVWCRFACPLAALMHVTPGSGDSASWPIKRSAFPATCAPRCATKASTS